MNIAFYKEDEFGTFPRRLSQLEAHYERIGQTNGVPDIFVCPRGAGKLDERYDGPLRKPHEPDPGPVLVITNWSQVDDGDYLYLQPPSNAEDTKPNTIILMTRPGLLYAGTVNIALLTGEVRTLKKEEWQRNSEVQLFLDMIRKSPGSPMKGSDQDKKAPP
ncbi:MAG: hypothetical protein EXS18_00920 [Verrucomicrobiae bacterium]|nr:hypothetical protein [Verrucomicrobiae bacterium]